MTGATSFVLGFQQGIAESQERIATLEVELEQYRSVAEHLGASKAISELEKLQEEVEKLRRVSCMSCEVVATIKAAHDKWRDRALAAEHIVKQLKPASAVEDDFVGMPNNTPVAAPDDLPDLDPETIVALLRRNAGGVCLSTPVELAAADLIEAITGRGAK